ncbi:MAG: spore cortex-lytic protein [Clostridia bacterium]|nr:spore cortex-lytic protein [Clostridia bacterium]
MSEGYVIVQVYTSSARIPVPNAAVAITRGKGKGKVLLAFRVTNSSGHTSIATVETPPMSDSQTPGSGEDAFALCDVEVNHQDFLTMVVHNVQIFANETSIQNCELIPVDIDKDPNYKVENIDITAQNL